VCSYCGCHAIGPIGALAAEHELIQNLMGEVRRSVLAGDHATAVTLLGRLQQVLAEHDAVEELSIYPSMARHGEFTVKVASLFDEHDELDAVVDQALATARDTASAAVDWTPVLAGFQMLMEHIQAEENGMFPAAAIALDTADWERAERVRQEYRAAHGSLS